MIESKKRIKKIKEKPCINFYCMKCNLFFDIDEDTLLDDVKCPKCGTYKVFIELDFKSDKTPSYIS
ncbi:MAG: hypothetical protein ACTSRG_07780 [Candidatus Helarchaeota archaeon]